MQYRFVFLSLAFLFETSDVHASVGNSLKVECENGFGFSLVRPLQKTPGQPFSHVNLSSGQRLKATDDGADSDLTFGEDQNYLVMSVSIAAGREGRVVFNGARFKQCALAPSTEDLRCKFLGECN